MVVMLGDNNNNDDENVENGAGEMPHEITMSTSDKYSLSVTSDKESSSLVGVDDAVDASPKKLKRKKPTLVEIGALSTVRLKVGERISRIHPDFTTSLRRSRWRKKYLKGAFPVG